MSFFRTLLLALSATSALSAANINLWGVTSNGVTSAGDYSSGVTATSSSGGPCCQEIGLEAGTFGSGVLAMPSYTLTSGNTYTFYGSSAPDWTGVGSYYNINLFFGDNNDTTANISAYVQAVGDKSDFSASFAANPTINDLSNLLNSATPSANTLTYSDGTTTVTLTGLQYVPGTAGGSSNPYDTSLSVFRFDLTVGDVSSGVPEPATFALFGSAMIGVGVVRFRRSRKQ